MRSATASATKSGHNSRWIGTGAAASGGRAADAGRGRVARFDSSASVRFTATRISPRVVVSVYTPTSSVSVKLTTPRVTCALTVRPLGVVTVTLLTPCSTGSRIGWPAESCRLD